jgi:hypothetical protein
MFARAGFFITFWEGSSGDYWGWRILILLQVIPALGFAGCLRNLPESYVQASQSRQTSLLTLT